MRTTRTSFVSTHDTVDVERGVVDGTTQGAAAADQARTDQTDAPAGDTRICDECLRQCQELRRERLGYSANEAARGALFE
jgi:hypothetical protein